MSIATETVLDRPATLDKSADTSAAIHPLLRERWSPRAFAPDPVPTEQVLSLLEAARWSPSAVNEQPWSFIVIPRADTAAFAAAVESLNEGNRVWAQHVPLLVLAVARLVRERDAAPNSVALYDLGQAVAHLTVQAADLGLAVHQMGGFSAERAREAFSIPANHAPVTFLAIGKRSDPDDLPEPLRARELAPRQRKPLDAFVFGSRWGQASPLLGRGAPADELRPAGATTSWRIDPAHSTIAFSVRHMAIATVRGRFGTFSGTIVADDQNPTAAQVSVQIDAASIDTGNEQRDAHLRSAEFLDVEQDRYLTFKSTRVEMRDASRGRLYGELTMRDVTRPVVLDVEYNGTARNPFGATSAGFSAQARINRKDWGLSWNVALDTGGWLVGHEITIGIEVELVKE